MILCYFSNFRVAVMTASAKLPLICMGSKTCYLACNWGYMEESGSQAAEDEEVMKRLEHVRAVPKGRKKDYGAEMLKGYDPKYVEAAT